MRQRFIGAALVVVLFAAVAWISTSQQRGEPPRRATVPLAPEQPAQIPPPPPVFASEYYRDVKPVFDRRCLVCHAGYDAPCQLRLDSPEGLWRGAAPNSAFDSSRAAPAPLTRLFVDAKNTAEWRDKGFHAVLDESVPGAADGATAPQNGVLYRMLVLKREHPLPEGRLPRGFDVSPARRATCPRADEFADYAVAHALAGMPFGLPGLDDEEAGKVQRWLESGAKVAPLPPLAADLQKAMADWERFLNNEDLKSQLMGRYVYEHLFQADLYFGAREPRQFFRLVRSRTPGGQPIDVIASRRPADDPDVPRVFYRLQPVYASIAAKTHLPYLLDDRRMARWREWFLQADYSIDRLPPYATDDTGNPFVAFAALPVQSRYRFMLDDAAFFLGGFLKGPAARGDVALNVLQDRFWIAFANPDLPPVIDGAFLASESSGLHLPAEMAAASPGLGQWQDYATRQANYLAARDRHVHAAARNDTAGADARAAVTPPPLTIDALWNGGGDVAAAFTVFRHEDSASVVDGLVGDQPKTAWVMDYPLFERMHYQLVAGFDIHGDASHQRLARLYLDFVRMEAETNFLAFLPKARRDVERNVWYQDGGKKLRDSVYRKTDAWQRETGIDYRSKNSKREFFELLRARLGATAAQPHTLDDAELEASTRAALRKIAGLRGWPASYLPELTYIRLVIRGAPDQVFTLIRNTDYKSVAMLAPAQARRRQRFDSATLVPGIVGTHPDAIWVVKDSDLPRLAQRLATAGNRGSYLQFERDVVIARTNPKFWQHSDWLHNIYREQEPVGWGALDFSQYDR